MKPKTITLGELKSQLACIWDAPDDTEIYFGMGDLDFYRPKTRLYRSDSNVPAVVQIEFNEMYEITHG